MRIIYALAHPNQETNQFVYSRLIKVPATVFDHLPVHIYMHTHKSCLSLYNYGFIRAKYTKKNTMYIENSTF